METSDRYAELRVLLIQIRESPEVAAHEMQSLCDVTGLAESNIWQWNVELEGSVPWERCAGADAVIIGGAGVHSAVSDDHFTEDLIGSVRRLVEARKHRFGSCYGHQFIARALGGEVIHDAERAEVGSHDVFLLEEAEGDPVFGGIWADGVRTFPVLMGHQDRVSELPAGAVELSRSEICPNQSFRMVEAPVWTTQYHVELTPKRLIERLHRYADIYAPGDDTLDRLEAGLRETPECERIIHAFLEDALRNGV